jgi:hypothetical protein
MGKGAVPSSSAGDGKLPSESVEKPKRVHESVVRGSERAEHESASISVTSPVTAPVTKVLGADLSARVSRESSEVISVDSDMSRSLIVVRVEHPWG